MRDIVNLTETILEESNIDYDTKVFKRGSYCRYEIHTCSNFKLTVENMGGGPKYRSYVTVNGYETSYIIGDSIEDIEKDLFMKHLERNILPKIQT